MKLIQLLIHTVALGMEALCRDSRLAANTYDAAVETHASSVTRTNDSAITARHLLWAASSATACDLADATTPAIGTIDNTETSTGVRQSVLLLGKGDTKKMVINAAVAANEPVYQAASGKVAPTGSIMVGIALTAGSTDGDIIEVADCAPAAVLPEGVTMTATTSAADSLAIPITHRTVNKTTGADAEALTLADGAFLGQRLNINLVTDGGGDGTLTPTTPSGFATIVFADAGDFAELEWTTAGWRIVGIGGLTAQPTVTA